MLSFGFDSFVREEEEDIYLLIPPYEEFLLFELPSRE